MIRRISFLNIAIAVQFVLVSQSLAQEAPTLPELQSCPETGINLDLRDSEKTSWSQCEKWVWSCIVQGMEANLYEKRCVAARPDGDDDDFLVRRRYKLAAFFEPDQYKDRQAIRSTFLRTILWVDHYSNQIPPVGVRIVGAYFNRQLNLENVTTEKNLVIDASIFKRGIRMTNFRTTKNVSFDWSNVRGGMRLNRARIDGSLFIERGVFDHVDLRDSRIGASLEATGSVFNDFFQFDRAHIDGKAHFVYSRLTALAGRGARVGGDVELRWSDIRVAIDLSGAIVNGDVRLQMVTFGREYEDGQPLCDWDPRARTDNVLSSAFEEAERMSKKRADDLLLEVMYERPTRKGQKVSAICDKSERAKPFHVRRQVMLRDMRISGTLCIMDSAGRFPILSGSYSVTSDTTKSDIKRIGSIEQFSLDGTRSRSTVLRWNNRDSYEVWRAVNYSTGYMLLGLRPHPQRHFFDNWNIDRVGFLRPPASQSRDAAVGNLPPDPDSGRGLCDVTLEGNTLASPSNRDTQESIASLFADPFNHSGSYQPLGKIIASLENSNVDATYLKIEESKYESRKDCATSKFSKKEELPWEDNTAPPIVRPIGVLEAWKNGLSNFDADALPELSKLGLDTVCTVWQPISYYTTSFGHEPLSLLYYFVGLVIVFGVALRLFDRPDERNMLGGKRLGVLYALDMFIPVSHLRQDVAHLRQRPNKRWLQWWLYCHRTVGAILSLAIFLLVFKAF